jgi:hypothetical protein
MGRRVEELPVPLPPLCATATTSSVTFNNYRTVVRVSSKRYGCAAGVSCKAVHSRRANQARGAASNVGKLPPFG